MKKIVKKEQENICDKIMKKLSLELDRQDSILHLLFIPVH